MSTITSPQPSPDSQNQNTHEAWLTSLTPSLVALASGSTYALLATNAAFESFFGWKWGDPRTLLNLFHFEKNHGLADVIAEVLRSGSTSSVSDCAVRVADPSGVYSAVVLMDFTCFAMILSDDKTPAVLVHARMSSPSGAAPVRPTHEGQTAPLVEMPSMDQDRLALALEAVKMGAWEWNPISGLTVWNSQMYALIGLQAHSVAPGYAVFMHAVHPDDRAAMDSKLAESIAGKAELAIEFRVIRADTGEERWLASRGRARYGADGKAVVLHGVSFDITERIRNEQRLRSISQRRAEFLAVLGHELRNPLVPLFYVANTLEASKTSTVETVQAAQVIRRQVMQLTRLVDDLLEVSRIEQGKVELRKELVAVEAAVAAAVETVMPVIRERQQHLALQIPVKMMLEADPTRLIQVIGNLLNNASKFTQEGGHLTVTAATESAAVKIVVSDNGPGIDPAVLDTMFEPFTQGRISLDRARGGLGVGLSLVKKIVELHGGSVHVRTSNRGTAFTLLFPLPRRFLVLQEEAGGRNTNDHQNLKAIKFLIVEDNLDAARMLAEYLQMFGHEVVVAHDGEQGLEMARQHRPDVILMDIGLPKLDGWAAAMTLRADSTFKDTVMIAMSGYCQPQDYERSLNAGFNLHMPKPADLAEVFRYLEARGLLLRTPT